MKGDDSWIKRSPALIRLTGGNTFNSEPPLTWLMNNGFITPVSLHYVRNHGSVPRADWNEWTVEVCGLVDHPTIFTMTQLVDDFEPLELPVTLVCSGNRRKEHNMVKPTNGFHWGAAAVSTSVWLGSPLRVVLERCGIQSSAVYICFEGAEDLPGSKYGTSLRKEIAMDPTHDIILAYKQNGEYLEPDHGHPVRIIIPGFIGGRMVKWLKKIIVTAKESESHYHFKDNRVLPSHVDAKLANAEGWWYKPEYIINELNINSVITSPYHGEFLPSHSSATKRPYKLKGYAYSGGGRKVTRVEVTMDGGVTWRICEIDRRENPTKYGKYWCWCFWSLDVDISHLHEAKEIAVRAWDESLNTQPEKLIWNVLGMMNNCWFRVKMNACNTHKDEIRLRFEHPTIPGAKSGGWMAPQEQGRNTMNNSLPACKFSMSDVEEHNSRHSAWVAVRGHVYDCTELVDKHSGGPQIIVKNAGTDGTEDFDSYEHSDKAKVELENYRKGELAIPSDATDSAHR